MKNFQYLLFLVTIITQAQNTSLEMPATSNKKLTAETEMIEVSIKTGVENPDMQTLFQFENINQTEFIFDGEPIRGKYFVLRIKEFLDGDLIKTSTLFDERGNEYFRIDSSQTSFKLLSKIDKDDIKVWMKGNRFGSKQSYFPVTHLNGRYVVKDFFGSKKTLKEDINQAFHIMSVITPSRNPDGSGSYCRVSQSEVDPEELGKVFNIPHYYLIEIQFIE